MLRSREITLRRPGGLGLACCMVKDLTVPWTAARWFPLQVIEDATGVELSQATARAVLAWPKEKRIELVERLASSVVGSLAFDPEPPATRLDELSFGGVDREWRADGGKFALPNWEIRQQLLYLPSICVTDHFSRFLLKRSPSQATLAEESYEVFGTHRIGRLFDAWLESLSDLAPALRDGSVQLVIPCEMTRQVRALWDGGDTSSLRIENVLAEASLAYATDLDAAPDAANAFDLTAGAAFYKVDVPDPAEFYRTVASIVSQKSSQEVWTALRIPSKLARKYAAMRQAAGDQIPWEESVAMAMRGLFDATYDRLLPALTSNLALGVNSTIGAQSSVACMKLLGLKAAESALGSKKRDVAQTLSRFRLPNAGEAPLDLLLSVRTNEEAFGEVRRAVGDVVGQVATSNPTDQKQFEKELAQALEDLLAPKIAALQKGMKSSFFEKALVPGGLALGAGAVVLAVTQHFPPTALAAAALTPASYLADRLYKRYKRSGRRDGQIVEALISFRDMSRRV